jgi:hypothetical protein
VFGLALGLGVLLALIASATRANASELSPAQASTDAHVKKIIDSGNPHLMLAAAAEAHKAGDKKLGNDLTQKARDAAIVSPTAVYPSPFPDVPTPAWTTFVHALRTGAADMITPGNFLGLFGMGMLRLVDLGLATNPRKVKNGQRDDGKAVWVADWLPPFQPGPDKFLGSPTLQYHVFVKMIKADSQAIHAMPNAIGADIDGQKGTASGLLAVSKQAGLKGLTEWLASPAVRAQYKNTTAQFQKLNGIF